MAFQRAARTDKGVSACGQVVSFKISTHADDDGDDDEDENEDEDDDDDDDEDELFQFISSSTSPLTHVD